MNVEALSSDLVELTDRHLVDFSEESKVSICKAFFLAVKYEQDKDKKKRRKTVVLHVTPESDPELLNYIVKEKRRAIKYPEFKGVKYELTYDAAVMQMINEARANNVLQYRAVYYEKQRKPKLLEKKAQNMNSIQNQKNQLEEKIE